MSVEAKIPDFDKSSLLPAIIQHAESLVVLMLGYMNEEAYLKTCDEKKVTFFSRSKQRLWTKGETSGNELFVKEISVDCDRDTILVKALPSGPVCHTGDPTCFSGEHYEGVGILKSVEKIIDSRFCEMPTGSYVRSLIEKGQSKIAQKVGEEAVEVVIESMTGQKELLVQESADLIFHLLILLRFHEISLDEITEVLKSRQ